jgi:hypothetical protein
LEEENWVLAIWMDGCSPFHGIHLSLREGDGVSANEAPLVHALLNKICILLIRQAKKFFMVLTIPIV